MNNKQEKKEILKSYENLGGKIYDIRYKSEQEEKYNIIMKEVLVNPEDIVLDDGCGTGLFLPRFENICIGLDFSGRLLSSAKLRLKEKPKIHLIKGDAENLPFKASVFSKIFSITMMQNLQSPLRALLEIIRVGRSNSEVFLSVMKKAYSPETFIKILVKTNLKIKKIIKNYESKDWFAFF